MIFNFFKKKKVRRVKEPLERNLIQIKWVRRKINRQRKLKSACCLFIEHEAERQMIIKEQQGFDECLRDIAELKRTFATMKNSLFF